MARRRSRGSLTAARLTEAAARLGLRGSLGWWRREWTRAAAWWCGGARPHRERTGRGDASGRKEGKDRDWIDTMLRNTAHPNQRVTFII